MKLKQPRFPPALWVLMVERRRRSPASMGSNWCNLARMATVITDFPTRGLRSDFASLAPVFTGIATTAEGFACLSTSASTTETSDPTAWLSYERAICKCDVVAQEAWTGVGHVMMSSVSGEQ